MQKMGNVLKTKRKTLGGNEKMSSEKNQIAYEFTGARLVANTVVAGLSAGIAVIAVSGLVAPAIFGAAVGGLIGYSTTNRIPKIKN